MRVSGSLGWTDELHPDPANMKLQNMWRLCEAQEAVGVSPDQFHGFIFPYHKQVAELFGKTCYACCEPADPYWEDIKTLHNLRRVSVSQWADWKKMSEYMGRDFVFSYKASSTNVANDNMDEDLIHRELANILDITGYNNVEIVLKDLHTIGIKPEQVLYRYFNIKISKRSISFFLLMRQPLVII